MSASGIVKKSGTTPTYYVMMTVHQVLPLLRYGHSPPSWMYRLKLVKLDGDDLELQYHTLENLGKQGGMFGTIFLKAQNKIQDPATLERNAQDVKGGVN